MAGKFIEIRVEANVSEGTTGRPKWYDTGVVVDAVDKLSITATGTAKESRAAPNRGPDGRAANSTGADEGAAGGDYLAPGLTRFALVGKIGDAGRAFLVSSKFPPEPRPAGWTAPTGTGKLYLAFNDCNTKDPIGGDNEGHFLARIAAGAHRVIDIVAKTESGRGAWVPTGVYVEPGNTLETNAVGKATALNGKVPEHDANGMTDGSRTYPDFLVPSLAVGALVGKIGDGAPFFVGVAYSKPVQQSGQLYLGFNDSLTHDNAGKYTVTITTK